MEERVLDTTTVKFMNNLELLKINHGGYLGYTRGRS